ncbi:MAG TPA: hypothetical protein VGC34_14390 [Steroidobacteraceae bacterium]
MDTSAGFETRVMSQLQLYSEAAAAEQFERARLFEATRYRLARRQLSWGARVQRFVTLDTVGMAVLALLGAQAVWTGLPPPIMAALRQYAPQILTGVGMLLGTVPVIILGLARLPRRFARRMDIRPDRRLSGGADGWGGALAGGGPVAGGSTRGASRRPWL